MVHVSFVSSQLLTNKLNAPWRPYSQQGIRRIIVRYGPDALLRMAKLKCEKLFHDEIVFLSCYHQITVLIQKEIKIIKVVSMFLVPKVIFV